MASFQPLLLSANDLETTIGSRIAFVLSSWFFLALSAAVPLVLALSDNPKRPLISEPMTSPVVAEGTTNVAFRSLRSCVKKGYMKDDYIHLFMRRPVRISPIINRGYFARWAAIRKLLYQFLDVEKKTDEDAPIKKQILSLGAGFDTTYFQLQVIDIGSMTELDCCRLENGLRATQQDYGEVAKWITHLMAKSGTKKDGRCSRSQAFDKCV